MAVYYTRPDEGWSWVILLAAFGSNCIHGFFLTASSLLQLSLLDYYKESVFKTSIALSMFLGLYSTSGFLASLIANRWSCRVSMVTGGLIVSISLVVTAFMPNIILVIISLGTFGGIGMGICYTSSYVVIGYNFEKKRNFASGLSAAGIGIGGFAFAPLMQIASDFFGYHGLWLMCAGLTLQYCVFGSLFYPSKLEIDRKMKLKVIKVPSCDNITKKQNFQMLREICSVFTQRSLICVNLSMFLCNSGIFLIYLHFGSYVTSVGFSELDAAFLLSIFGICSCVFRVLLGMASNASNVDEFVMFGGTFTLTGLSTMIFPLYGQTYSGQVFYMVTLGMYCGGCYVLLNSIIIILAGIKNLATVFGFILVFTGVGTFIGPLLGAAIVDLGGTYGLSIAIAGVIILVGSLFAWASGAGDRHDIKDISKAVVYQDGENTSFIGDIQEHLFKNNNQHVEENRQLV